MKQKVFFGTCVDNPFISVEKLIKIIDEAKEISKRKFLLNCNVNWILQKTMREYPNDFTFSQNGDIMFYTHSAIEYFYS